MTEPRLLTAEQVSEAIAEALAPTTIDKWARRGRITKSVKIGRERRYLPEAVDEIIALCLEDNTSAAQTPTAPPPPRRAAVGENPPGGQLIRLRPRMPGGSKS